MHLIETVWQDAERGARALARTPGFAAAAILTLALGIGATTAIFSVVNAVLLSALPYSEPGRRVMIWSRWTGFDKTWVSEAEVLDYRRLCRTLTDVAAWDSGQVNLTGGGDPIRIGSARITANTFTVLGVQPLYGRGFTLEEARPNAGAVAILSHGLWQRRYGGDPEVVGQRVQIDGVPRAIVGIMPPGFRLPTDFGEDAAEPTQIWLPLATDLSSAERGNHGLYAAAQLAPGATAESASAELRAITANLTREGLYPPAMDFSALAVSLEEEIRGAIRPAMLLLFGAVGFLLLIACANVAHLLLVRAAGRQREMAVRTALGAGPGRLVRQLLTESFMLAVLSAIIGLVVAWAGVHLLMAFDPANLPRLAPVALDGRVLAFTALLTIMTTVVFGLAPATRALHIGLTDSLKEGGHQSTVGKARQLLRALLVIGETALAVMLVIGAGLMMRSLAALQNVNLGFQPEHVLTVRLSLPESSYEQPERVISFYTQLLDRVRSLPGVRHAGVMRSLPLANTIGDWGLAIDGYVETPGRAPKGDWQVVSEGAVEALGERLVRGRLFTSADSADAQQVALVNETMARTYWPDGDPIGKRMRMGSMERPWMTIVGIVADVRHNGLEAPIKEKFYRPASQFHRSSGNPPRNMALVVKAAGDPLALAAPIKAAVHMLDPNLPVANVRTLTDIVATTLATPRFTGFLLGGFAMLALALAAIGIYGVLTYLVSQRSHEIGIRMAIGADRSQILRMVLGHGLVLALVGVAVGTVLALGATRLMQSLLYEIQPNDAVTFVSVPIVLIVVTLVASYIPALRATRVDPIVALRAE